MQVTVQPHAPAVLPTGKPALYPCSLYITHDCHTETRNCNLQSLQEGKYLNPDLSVENLISYFIKYYFVLLKGFLFEITYIDCFLFLYVLQCLSATVICHTSGLWYPLRLLDFLFRLYVDKSEFNKRLHNN
jgi:hypothetical protein